MKLIALLVLSIFLSPLNASLITTTESTSSDCSNDPWICQDSEICREGKCVDGCQSLNCGINAESECDQFAFKCICLEGMAGDPLKECFDHPCERFPCGKNANCFIEGSDLFCECNEGMIGDPFKECWMVGEDICVPNPCGENSKCIKEPEPGCICLPEFYGKPPNCRAGCENDFQCSDDEFCDVDKNLCKFGCRYDSCGQKEFCDFKTRECKFGCSFNDDCEDNEFCDYSKNKCVNPCDANFCGENSSCRSFGHSKNVRCSCKVGLNPQPHIGCENKFNNLEILEKEINCTKFCARHSKCELLNGIIECFCPDEPYEKILNPFSSCIVKESLACGTKNRYNPVCKHSKTDSCAIPPKFEARLRALAG